MSRGLHAELFRGKTPSLIKHLGSCILVESIAKNRGTEVSMFMFMKLCSAADKTCVGILFRARDIALADTNVCCLQYCLNPTFDKPVATTPFTSADVFILRDLFIQLPSASFRHASNVSMTVIIQMKNKKNLNATVVTALGCISLYGIVRCGMFVHICSRYIRVDSMAKKSLKSKSVLSFNMV